MRLEGKSFLLLKIYSCGNIQTEYFIINHLQCHHKLFCWDVEIQTFWVASFPQETVYSKLSVAHTTCCQCELYCIINIIQLKYW